jgi:hypothetical protein
MPDAAAATTNGRLDGFLLQREDQAADGRGIVVGGDLRTRRTAGRRLAGRRLPRSAPLLAVAGLQGAQIAHGKRRRRGGRRIGGPSSEGIAGSVRSRAPAPSGAVGSLALRLAVVSHSPFQFRRALAPNPLARHISHFPVAAQAGKRGKL